jgi:hypothetical protein
MNLNPFPLKCEERDDGRNGDPAAKGRSQDVVVLLPPAEVSLSDVHCGKVSGAREGREVDGPWKMYPITSAGHTCERLRG